MPFHVTGAVVAAPPWFGAAADAQLDANTNAAGVVCSVSTAAACPQYFNVWCEAVGAGDAAALEAVLAQVQASLLVRVDHVLQ